LVPSHSLRPAAASSARTDYALSPTAPSLAETRSVVRLGQAQQPQLWAGPRELSIPLWLRAHEPRSDDARLGFAEPLAAWLRRPMRDRPAKERGRVARRHGRLKGHGVTL